jgi:hypothetical protein
MAIALSGALLLAACGSDGEQQPQPLPPVPPSYNPPRNAMAPLPNGQQPTLNGNAPALNPSAPSPNPQQPTPTRSGGGGSGLPPQIVQSCRNLCGFVESTCRASCDAYCDAFSSISGNCAAAAAALLVCYAQEGAECRQDGDLDLPGRCRNELIDSMAVSEACLDELFP